MRNHSWLSSTYFRRLAALAFVVLAVGLLGIGRTPVAVGLFNSPWDKLAHVATFALAAGLLATSLGAGRVANLLLAFVVVAGLGAADELQQLFLPGRSAAWSDFLGDLVGAIIGLSLARLLLAKPRASSA